MNPDAVVAPLGLAEREAEWAREILKFHVQGISPGEAADYLGITPEAAWRLGTRLADEIDRQTVAEQRRGMALSLVVAERKLAGLLDHNDPNVCIRAAKALANVVLSRARLVGVDGPVQLALTTTVTSPVDDELASLADLLGGNDSVAASIDRIKNRHMNGHSNGSH